MAAEIENSEVVILGAGAAGLMCAIHAGRRGRRVVVLDHGSAPGCKIRVSGGGRCNFTNTHVQAENYISHNPHFCKSALSRFSQWDFLELLQKHCITYEEREQGRLFCSSSAGDLVRMLILECRRAGVVFHFTVTIESIGLQADGRFSLRDASRTYVADSLVVATGGLSMPALGASGLGYDIAKQFGIAIQPTAAGLVPLSYGATDRQKLSALAGIALTAKVHAGNHSFTDRLLFTHRGVSGPAILQISSYWQPGQQLQIDLLPNVDLRSALQAERSHRFRRQLKTVLAAYLPRRLVEALMPVQVGDCTLGGVPPRWIETSVAAFKQWSITPAGRAGYGTAEVTVGGVDCDAISSKTMQAVDVPGLFFCGEVLDVTGWLGGYNLQWAWSSGWCAGQYV